MAGIDHCHDSSGSCSRAGGPDACGATCPMPAPTRVVLAEALARHSREARTGVCDTGRYRCRYSVWGEGPALLCVPGLSDDALSFVQLASLLSQRFRCITFDPPSGDSDGARLRKYTHQMLVEDVYALLDHLETKQSYLFGSSFGSTITLVALREHPERFPRAILQGGFARRRLAPAEVLLASLARFIPFALRDVPMLHRPWKKTHGEPFASREPEVWDFMVERWGSAPVSTVARRALLMHRLDLRPMLGEIRQPVLMICGDRDPLVNHVCEEELLRGLPQVARVELEGCGHNPIYTHPETLAELVAGFLTPAP